ncbi:hypothetical protein [Hydrogenibacillus sp. N12]|uniref:hypothetical protein n=1 Tax=Hydrogenibacillus sp. N12 TaxID=2866627 RepID=UPI001C7CDF9D|nr:hypothetical protein [Hydrogenibacillus sp. N12]QZA33462.1 hypothetical protein K2M58_02650 [Hydrogenibacillus sp. N12]
MDPATLLSVLRSPSGVGMYPAVIQLLYVLTWAVHITFIHLTIGGLFVALYAAFRRRDPLAQKLARTSVKTAVVGLSLGVVFGVAPLLFTQVIYDSGWYTANTLSAWWVIAFIPVVIAAYYLIYAFYLKARRAFPAAVPEGARTKAASPAAFAEAAATETAGPRTVGGGGIAALFGGLVLVLFAGAIMHIMAYQALFPDRWIDWYTAGGTTMHTSGLFVYAFNAARYALFVLAALFVYGLYLQAYAWYFAPRPDADRDALRAFAGTGRRLAAVFGPFAVLAGFAYLALDGLLGRPAVAGAFLLAVAFGALAVWSTDRDGKTPPRALAFGFLAELALSAFREADRFNRYGAFGHTPYDYPLHLSPYGFFFFLGTFAVGIAFFAFLLRLLFRAGRSADVVTDDQVAAALGRNWQLSWGLLIAWLIVFWGLGLAVVFFPL